jgi:hypothetical protein
MTLPNDERPTLPRITNLQTRSGLVSALTLLEAIHGNLVGIESLRHWYREAFPTSGAPRRIWEDQVHILTTERASAALDERTLLIGRAAQEKVVTALRGLLATPEDDSFVRGAIYSDRVERVSERGAARWAARLRGDEALSDAILALFAADLLEHRASYEGRLAICDQCNRVTFSDQRLRRRECHEHRG